MVLWSRIRGFMVAHSWFYGRAFVVLWSKLRGLMVKTSWFYGRAFVVLWSPLRGFMVKTSGFYGRGALGLSKGLLRFSWISRCVQEYGSRVGWGLYG